MGDTLLTPLEIAEKIPLSNAERDFVLQSRSEIVQILEGRDPRLLLILGPCSIHDPEAVLVYAEKLKQLKTEIDDHFYIVMRSYFEKPRTCHGWRGFLHDPFLDGSHHFQEGFLKTRRLLKTLTEIQVPLACEFLDPATLPYLSEWISWGCIGSRTVSSPIHRQMASKLPMPVAFKNSTDGSLSSALLAIEVAKKSHRYLSFNDEGRLGVVHSPGNPHAHLVLRGGDSGPNYQPEFIQKALQMTPYLLVDCAHGNSKKQAKAQINVFESVLTQVLEGNTAIRGMMLESFLREGNQSLENPLLFGVSITDPCLDFEMTRETLLKGAALISPCVI